MTSSDENMVLTHIEAGVLTITLNRPDRLNSFNDEMHRQLSEALKLPNAMRPCAAFCSPVPDGVSVPDKI